MITCLFHAGNAKVESDVSAAQLSAPGSGKYVPPHQSKRLDGAAAVGSRMGRDGEFTLQYRIIASGKFSLG